MNKLISVNYWFGCDWGFYEVGYLGLHAGQLSLACAVVYLWNTGYLQVTRPRLCPGFNSVIAAKDPITCAAYAKEKNLYNLDGWKRFRHHIKKGKQLTRAIKQSKIRQVRHAKKYIFGFLIPRNYIEALEFDKANNSSKWYDATKAELDSIHS